MFGIGSGSSRNYAFVDVSERREKTSRFLPFFQIPRRSPWIGLEVGKQRTWNDAILFFPSVFVINSQLDLVRSLNFKVGERGEGQDEMGQKEKQASRKLHVTQKLESRIKAIFNQTY